MRGITWGSNAAAWARPVKKRMPRVYSAPYTQEIPVGVTQQASDADVTWSGTVTLTSMP